MCFIATAAVPRWTGVALLGTPEELAELQQRDWNRRHARALLTTGFMVGDADLVTDYRYLLQKARAVSRGCRGRCDSGVPCLPCALAA